MHQWSSQQPHTAGQSDHGPPHGTDAVCQQCPRIHGEHLPCDPLKELHQAGADCTNTDLTDEGMLVEKADKAGLQPARVPTEGGSRLGCWDERGSKGSHLGGPALNLQFLKIGH